MVVVVAVLVFYAIADLSFRLFIAIDRIWLGWRALREDTQP